MKLLQKIRDLMFYNGITTIVSLLLFWPIFLLIGLCLELREKYIDTISWFNYTDRTTIIRTILAWTGIIILVVIGLFILIKDVTYGTTYFMCLFFAPLTCFILYTLYCYLRLFYRRFIVDVLWRNKYSILGICCLYAIFLVATVLFAQETHNTYAYYIFSGVIMIPTSLVLLDEITEKWIIRKKHETAFSWCMLPLIGVMFFLVPAILESGFPTDNPSHYYSAPSHHHSTPYGDSDVFITKHGHRYHKGYCGSIQNSYSVEEVSIEDAEARGYTPCHKCFK